MTVTFREAREKDVPHVVRLLANDVLGQGRETDDMTAYLSAFRDMQDESGNTLIVGEEDGKVVATYQITVITGLSLTATRRAQLEGVRVDEALRGQGVGKALLADAEDRARACGAGLMQFTTNKSRDRAHAFYRSAGYIDTHLGFKKTL